MNINGKTTNPGELRTQIKLQTKTVSTETGGFQRDTWADLATVWAKWVNAHGNEVWAADSAQAEMPATVLIRYRSDVNTQCAVLKGTVRYEIVSMDDIFERHEYLELKVKRMASG